MQFINCEHSTMAHYLNMLTCSKLILFYLFIIIFFPLEWFFLFFTWIILGAV